VVLVAVRTGAAGRGRATILQLEVPAGGELRPAPAGAGEGRPGPGGAVGLFRRPELAERAEIGASADLSAAIDDDEILDQLIDRIVAEVEQRPLACLWCLISLPGCGGSFCSDYCREQYFKKLVPPPHTAPQLGVSRPAPLATKRAMAGAHRALFAKKRWQRAHPLEQA
jgi:hypothetical protein